MNHRVTYRLILPFLEADIGISALRLDYSVHVGMSCAHTELERRRFARYPAVYSFRVIDATAFYCGKHVERPENPAKKKRSRSD